MKEQIAGFPGVAEGEVTERRGERLDDHAPVFLEIAAGLDRQFDFQAPEVVGDV